MFSKDVSFVGHLTTLFFFGPEIYVLWSASMSEEKIPSPTQMYAVKQVMNLFRIESK